MGPSREYVVIGGTFLGRYGAFAVQRRKVRAAAVDSYEEKKKWVEGTYASVLKVRAPIAGGRRPYSRGGNQSRR
eukprot:1195559-Prorocentrum_minimum.AAC.4